MAVMGVPCGNGRFRAKAGLRSAQRFQLAQTVPNTLMDSSHLIPQRRIVPVEGRAVKVAAVLPQRGVIVITCFPL